MIGAIIGDIVGSRWEFNPTNDYEFEWLSDQNDFTDDTICTVEEIEQSIISFLTEEMKEVVEEFYKRIS